ncbi:hypothetical protein M8312_08465 [Sphingomonas sp. KRR8]|uniref:hypothetical protein n=1 Tax=Sphingomonas sp. KRR8 TaxID=2942996 RepID=UPI0020214785|nr:hypothetical protein [Sphingomonas sp. KRR8]URD59848.1 hypothetical protein M8312_08465 [Sphingomonas sp. KRR8]
MLKPIITAAALAGFAFAPAQAQDSSDTGRKIAEIIVYGNDPCPRSTDSEVVVCARKPETERFRIPERLRNGGSRQSRQAWANRARSFEVATRTGVATCDAIGPGGQNGCLQKMIDQARAERAEQDAADSPPPR